MVVQQLAELTWTEMRDLDSTRTVAILPVGAIEAHGPHLPLGTDVIIAQAMAGSGATRILAHGLGVALMPPLVFTAAPFGAEFSGTLSIAPSTVTALLLDLARELTRHRFAALAIANAHLDPTHLASLAAATRQAEAERLLPVIFPDVTKKPWAPRLTEEFKSGACHAGQYEGSIVMAARPELVRDETRRTLPPNPSSLSKAIREGARTFAEAGGSMGYFGSPAQASAQEGEASIEVLGGILAEAVLAVLAPGRPA